MTFRDDLDLRGRLGRRVPERAGDLPVAARVEPGDVRARLPESAPEQGEPFEALLGDLDELILPGLTHWNHPRFFAWFANTGSEPGDARRAADRGAERQQHDLARRRRRRPSSR